MVSLLPKPPVSTYTLHDDTASACAKSPSKVWTEPVHVLVGPTWSISVLELPPGAVRTILQDLTCVPNAERAEKNPFRKKLTFCLGELKHKRLHVPPWYGKAAFPAAVITGSTLTRGEPATFGEFKGALREHPPQRAAAERYLSWLGDHQTTPSCILSLPCGYGKTVLCLWLLAALGRRACVIAHTNALVDQWMQEVRRFLPHARLGYVKEGGDVRVDDVDIVIASLQSLRPGLARGYEWAARLVAATGSVVLDEGHHAVATTFWEVLSAIPAAYRLVLTATPRRGDGLGPQLAWVSGPVIFKAIRTVDEVHIAHVCFLSEAHPPIVRQNTLQIADMVNALCEDEARTALAVAVVTHLVTTQRRRVIVITPRVTHIHVLADAIEAQLAAAKVPHRTARLWRKHAWKPPARKPKKKLKAGECELAAAAARDAAHEQNCEAAWDAWLAAQAAEGFVDAAQIAAAAACTAEDRAVAAGETAPSAAGATAPFTHAWNKRTAWLAANGPGHWETVDTPLVGRVLANTTTDTRTVAFESPVFVASDLLLREGVSVVEMDTLVSLANLKDVEQAVGRILRDCKTKRVPLMVDFYMAEGVFAGLHRARCKHYADQGFQQWWLRAAGPADLQPAWWGRFDKDNC